MSGPFRVMVVDDSAIVRAMVARWLEGEADIEVAALATNGLQAVRRAAEGGLDVILLDIEMPVMDGVEALARLVADGCAARIIMASSLTTRHARISFRALTMGAADFVAKPSAARAGDAEAFRAELLGKIRAHGRRTPAAGRGSGQEAASAPGPSTVPPPVSPGEAAMPQGETAAPAIIAIGGSTGGPQALFRLFADFPLAHRLPVVIAQHMPATFTAMLARHLGEVSGLPCLEGVDGADLLPGHVHVAPGGLHMRVRRTGSRLTLALGDDPPVNFCRPAVDPLFESVAAAAGAGAVGVVLTGMGADGRAGACAIRAAGGRVVVQDRASSVIWGMPGAVVAAGAADAELPIGSLAHGLAALLARYPVRAPGGPVLAAGLP